MTDESPTNDVGQPASENNLDILSLHGTKGKAGYELMHPKGSVGATIGTVIFEKHGQDQVEKLYPAAVTAFKTGHSINEAVDIASTMSGEKQVPAYIKGKPAGYLPPGSDIYVGASFKGNPKDAQVIYGKSGSDYYSVTSGGVAKVQPGVAPTLQKSIDNGVFVKVPYGYGDLPEKKAPVVNAPAPNAPSPNAPNPNAPSAIFINGKKVANTTPGSKVYVTKNSATDNNGKNSGMAFVQDGQGNWSVYVGDGKASPQSTSTAKALEKDAAEGGLVEVHNPDDTPLDNTLATKTPDPNALGKKPVQDGSSLLDEQGNPINKNDFNANEAASFQSQNLGGNKKTDANAPSTPDANKQDANKPATPGDEKSQAAASGDLGEVGAATPPAQAQSTDLKDSTGKPILPPPSSGMAPNQSTLQKPAPAAPKPVSTQQGQGGDKKFEVLPDSGDSGDGYFADPGGAKLWGKYGAAGVMLRHTDKDSGEEKFLLVQRGPAVSTNKGKWQLPGGALNSNENDYNGTARELTEELQPPNGYLDTVQPKGEVLFNHPSGWHYNNIVADVPEQFDATVDGDETGAAKWMTFDEVQKADLHPALKSNLDAIMEQFGGPAGSNSDQPTDRTSTTENFGDAAAPPEPDAVNAALNPDLPPEQPKTAPKPVFVNGTQVGEVPQDSKIIVQAIHKSDPNGASTAYVINKDGTGEVFNGPGDSKKMSDTLTNVVKQYQNEGSYIDVDQANAENEALAAQQLDPNKPKTPGAPGIAPASPGGIPSANAPGTATPPNNVPGTSTPGPDPWDVPNPDTADPFADLSPTPEPDPGENGDPVKDVFLKGEKVGEIPESSTIYISPSSFKNQKNAPYVYAKHSDGSFTVFEHSNPNGKNYDADSSVGKFINQDIIKGSLAKVDNYDKGDGTDESISPVSASFNAPSPAKIDVGGVMVNAKEIATAITALKNGESWQVKVHLKNHPLHKMDYISLAKKENDETGQSYPTKEAVIRALEKKFKKLPATDAEEAAVESSVKSLDEMQPPKTEVEVGGIKVNKKQLQGAIDLVESGPSPYPKVNLKGHTLHGLDMPNIMWQESKKPEETTKAVLLKHMKKKLKQFHDDELTGEAVVDPPKEEVQAVKGLAQLVKEAADKKEASIPKPPQENHIDIGDGLSLKPGVYKKPGGYFAKVIVEPDGSMFYHGSEKTGKLPITKKKAASLHGQGFSHYVGPVEGPTADNGSSVDKPTVNVTVDAPAMHGWIDPGKYFSVYTGGNYESFPDGSANYSSISGDNLILTHAEMKKVVEDGGILDKYGSTVMPPGAKPADVATYHVFGSKGMTLTALKDMRDDVASTDVPSTLLTAKYKINSDSFLDYMKANTHHGGIKNTVLYKLDQLIHASETKQTSNPSTGGIEVNDNAKKASGIFTFHPKTGYATSPVKQPGVIDGMSESDMENKINEISNAHGYGVVGDHGYDFQPSDAKDWLNAWYKGDMSSVYKIDAQYSNSSDDLSGHPGAPHNKATNKIVWQPAVEGEVPAGVPVSVPGDSLDPKAVWDADSVNQYLVAANAQNTEYMSPVLKNQWVKAHASGDKLTTDVISNMIKKLADDPGSAPTGFAAATPAGGASTEPKSSYAGYLDGKTSTYDWEPNAINDFLTDNGLTSPYGTGVLDKADTVQDFLDGYKSVQVNDTLVKKVQNDSVIYHDPKSSMVIVKKSDGNFVKFGTELSGTNGKVITNPASINLLNSEIANGNLLPWNADKTKIAVPSTLPTGPVQLKVAKGQMVDVDPSAELYAFHNKKGEINGFFAQFPDGKITYNGINNNYSGVNNVGKKKFQDNLEAGLITKIPNPAQVPTTPEPVAEAAVYKIEGNKGLVLGNNQKTTNVSDQFGNMYVYKPYKESEMFRAHAEHGANTVARMFGFPTAESKLAEIDGTKGQLQNKHLATGDFTGIGKEDIAKMPQTALNDLAKEHLLDWQLENPDGRQLNLLQLKDGSVVGVDKGMFGKHWGQWNGLEPNNKNVMYEPLAYTKLYDGIRDGLYSQDQIDSIYKSVMTKARDMERVPDADLHSVVKEAMTSNPNHNEEDFANGFIARKNQLMDDMNKLWDRVYAMTDYKKPEFKANLVNDQGHILHAGFTGDHVADVAKTKSYGTAAFFGGTDVEDMHVLTWREKVQGGGVNVRGELKVRGGTLGKIQNWLKSRATGASPSSSEPPPPQVHDMDAAWHDTILKAAGNVAYHSTDGNYNVSKLDAMENTKKELNQLLSDNETNPPDSSEVAKISAQNEMAKLYLGYIKHVEEHKADGTKADKDLIKRYKYTPPPKSADPVAAVKKPSYTVKRVQATRAQNVSPGSSGTKITLDSDGELLVSSTKVLDGSNGNTGQMYLVTLETGETIEFRGNDTGTSKTSVGLTRYTIPPEQNPEVSLGRIQNHLKEMGLDLKPAEESDYELYYWRHLANIMRDRKDSKPGDSKYSTFWNLHNQDLENKGGPEELNMWRNAFASITSKKQVDDWVKNGGHLPQFQHWDINNPTQATSKPWWKRFDVTKDDIEKSDFLIMQGKTSNYVPSVAKTGGSMSTEGRLRAFGTWLSGNVTMSSSTDQGVGSSAFVFTRQGQTENGYMNHTRVVLAKHVTARSHNYAYRNDSCGDISYKKTSAKFNYPSTVSYAFHEGESGNEMMVKDGVSVLDDVEIMYFDSAAERDDAIKYYTDRGITTIRGVPISMRFIYASSGYDVAMLAAKKKAIKELREYYDKNK